MSEELKKVLSNDDEMDKVTGGSPAPAPIFVPGPPSESVEIPVEMIVKKTAL